jgi:hypothetical protein
MASLGSDIARPRAGLGHTKILIRKVNFPDEYFCMSSSPYVESLPSLGAICQVRTDDLRFTKPLLYRLS